MKMEVKYRSTNGMFEVNFDVKSPIDLFQALADFQEVFEMPEEFMIGKHKVHVSDIRFKVRNVDGNEFYELTYAGQNKDLWGYRKSFGCSKEKKGHLFPKWNVKEEDKDKYENGGGGWFKWKSTKDTAPKSTGSNEDVF